MDTWDTSCEPMDIDLSIHSDNNTMDIDNQDSFQRSPTPSKLQTVMCDDTCNDVVRGQDLLIGLKVNRLYKEKKEQRKWHHVFISFVLFTSLIFIILSIVNYIFDIKCNDELNMTELTDTFRSRVYGQTVAVENFIKALDSNDSKLLILYGGTGVGKTLTVSLLLNFISNYTNTYHYTMPTFAQTIASELMLGLILCKTSTIVIDDLTIQDTAIRKTLRELMVKAKDLHKKVTIILIYNCDNTVSKLENSCDENFVSDLELKLHDIEVQKTYIKFKPLTEESLKKCIQYELGTHCSKSKLLKMLKNFDVHQDGCKGVHQKIKYLNIV